MTTWDANAKLIAGLWPNYAPTAEEKALYAERLGHRRQDWLEEAVKRHRSEDADGAFKPKLSRIIAHYDQIRDAGDDKRDGPRQNEKVPAVTWAEVDADDQAMTAELLRWDVKRVAEAVTYLRSLHVGLSVVAVKLPPRDADLPTDPRQWPRPLRGLVWAAGERLSELRSNAHKSTPKSASTAGGGI